MSRPDPTPTDRSPSDPAEQPARGIVTTLVLLDASDERFAALTAALLDRIDPDDALGRLLAELVVIAAGRLRKAALLEPTDTLPGLDWCRFHSLAERNLRAAAKDLLRHLEARSKSATTAANAGTRAEPDAPEPPPTPDSTTEEIVEAAGNWRRHIALVRSVSEEWPIILRLGREVEDVAAWLNDGKTEAELMRWYPGLTRADIAACRACDAEGLCGPFDTADGPYPPGLPVFDDLPDEPHSP